MYEFTRVTIETCEHFDETYTRHKAEIEIASPLEVGDCLGAAMKFEIPRPILALAEAIEYILQDGMDEFEHEIWNAARNLIAYWKAHDKDRDANDAN